MLGRSLVALSKRCVVLGRLGLGLKFISRQRKNDRRFALTDHNHSIGLEEN